MLALSPFSPAQATPFQPTTALEARMGQSLPDEHALEIGCRPSGAGCQVMNGKNPEPDNNLCCSQHCNWSNGNQAYLCD
jgi:hypothetical protein